MSYTPYPQNCDFMRQAKEVIQKRAVMRKTPARQQQEQARQERQGDCLVREVEIQRGMLR
jgi:hypothetical protein